MVALVFIGTAYTSADRAETELEMAMSMNGHAVEVIAQERLRHTVAWCLTHQQWGKSLLTRSGGL